MSETEKMTVYAVMRGTEFYGVYATPELAQQVVDRSNQNFPRGKRYEVAPLPVRDRVPE